jgi:hypothetical protein
VAHAVVIAACVVGTMPTADLPSDSFANRVIYVSTPGSDTRGRVVLARRSITSI